MLQNNSKNWSIGLPFVQWGINTDYHSGIKKTPYELRYGQKAVRGLNDLPLTRELSARLATEEDLWDALPEGVRAILNEANEMINARTGETLGEDPRDSESHAGGSVDSVDSESQDSGSGLNAVGVASAMAVSVESVDSESQGSGSGLSAAGAASAMAVSVDSVDSESQGSGSGLNAASAASAMAVSVDSRSMNHALPTLPADHVLPSDPIDLALVKLTGVLEKFTNKQLKPLTVRGFARGSSLTGGPGMVSCSCGKSGKCTTCKCAKAGRRCNSSCKCARFSMCTNMEEMLAIDDAVMEANVALTRSEVGSEEFSD
eukprot:COSAG02_NODE_2356_length_9072_cov_14.450017_1_plen_317_part_00